jgi:hypothetical protein
MPWQRPMLWHCCMFEITLAPGGSRLGIALAAARERGMLGGDYIDDCAAGAGSPSMMLSPTKEARHEDVTPLQSPGGVGDDDTFANFV